MDYYSLHEKELLLETKIPLKVGTSSQAVFKSMAEDMLHEIKKHNEMKEPTLFIVPVGPVGQYSYFVEMVNDQQISLKHVTFINMDEYLDEEGEFLPLHHRLSFRSFMENHVYSHIDSNLIMPEEQRVFPDPHNIEAVEKAISKVGKIDVCYGGIGITGHIAFNEPENVSVDMFANRSTRVLEISQETRIINSVGDLYGAVEKMPTHCITVGMKEILMAQKIRLYCFRDWHRAVVRRAACGHMTAQFPVTLIQRHPDASITMTDNVALPCYDTLQ